MPENGVSILKAKLESKGALRNRVFIQNEVLNRLLISLAIGFILEAGTLKGARIASVLRIEDWRPVRLLIFAAIAFILISLYEWAKSSGYVQGLCKTACLISEAIRDKWKSVVVSIFGAVIGTIAVALISMAMFGSVDSRIVLVTFMALLSTALILSNWKLMNENAEYLFLVIAIPLAFIYTYLMPMVPEVSWDGQIHFSNAVRLSYLVDAEFTKADMLMSNSYAVSELDLVGTGAVETLWHPKQDLQSIELASEQITEIDSTDEITVCDGFLGPTGEAPLSVASIGVLPHALGLWVGRLFGLPIIHRMFLARLISVLSYIIVIFYGIKALKFGKLLASSLALLITPLMMSSCFSYDPWCYAFILSAVCHILGKLQTGVGSISKFDFLVTTGLLFIGCLVKAVYFPLFLSLVFLPSSYFKNRYIKTQSLFIIVITIMILSATFVLPTVYSSATGTETVDTRAESGVSASGQIKFAITHFPSFMAVIIGFIVNYLVTTPITASIGTYFTYLYNSPDLLGYLAWLLIGIGLFFELARCRVRVQLSVRLSAAAGVAASLFLSVCALYASFTPVGEGTVYGFQWRYLIPFYPFMFLLVLNPSGFNSRSLNHISSFRFLPIIWVIIEFLYQFINIYCGFIAAF